jgi:type IV pilus assembly protein PilB
MAISDDQLYQLLLENEYFTEEQLKAARETARQENTTLYNALIEKDFVSDENLGKIISDYLKLPFVNLSKISIPDDILRIVPESLARRQKLIVYGQSPQALKIATANPQSTLTLQFIQKKAARPVQIAYATEKDINEAFHFYKKQLQTKFDELLKKQLEISGKAQVNDLPVTKIVDQLIEYAYDNKASDIHIEPRKNDSITRFRIDGIMHNVLVAPKSLHNQMITRIKILAKLPTDEHLKAQDGKLQIRLEEEELDVRVSIVPIVEGESAVLRLLSSRSRQFSLSDLGMSERDLLKVRNAYQKPYGMLLVTGPTGSGKTTSIYAVLKILNTKEKNIDTIEDPVEYEIQGINQIQVNPQTNLTFADGLRSILRQDPDIIFVGEIRDKETASIAINSAMTGHLVLSTLHTNDAATAIPRLIDMDVEPFLVSSTVNVVIGQRLVRKICDSCKVSYTQTTEELNKSLRKDLVEKHFGTKTELRMYKGKGCSVCQNTGYVGRIGIYEVLEITKPIQTLINQKADAELIREKAIEEGMSTMLEDGLDKVQQGITTLEEVLRVTKE